MAHTKDTSLEASKRLTNTTGTITQGFNLDIAKAMGKAARTENHRGKIHEMIRELESRSETTN